MPSWNDLLAEFEKLSDDREKNRWLRERSQTALRDVSGLRSGTNVLFYASAFLTKPAVPAYSLQLTHEEINGFMSVMYGMKWENGLTLILHTPGGVTNAAETIVAYLHSKFDYIEVVVPTYAMSAGTMISLAANKIIMGRQSQLGPIDPQIPIGGRTVSAGAIIEQFRTAKRDLKKNLQMAHLWAPILQTLGPALVQEASNALQYGETMVRRWLATRMFKDRSDAQFLAKKAASHFSKVSLHKSHGRRIDRDEARSQGIIIEDLEASQELQDSVLTAYHWMTIVFEKSPACKVLVSNHDRMWVKNLALPPAAPQRASTP